MKPFTHATIGTLRGDGDFAILATLNNNDERIPEAEFAAMACALAMKLAAATGEPVRVYERQDAPDYIDLEGDERLIMEGVDTTASDMDFVTVRRATLRPVLDYLHENEADHYDEIVSEYPDTAHEHIYRFVLDIERELESRRRS